MGHFEFLKKKIKNLSTYFAKSMTFKNDFLIFGRVKKIVGSCPLFWTLNFLLVAYQKGFNFMIAFDHSKWSVLDIWIIGNLSKYFEKIHNFYKWFSHFELHKKFCGFESIILDPKLCVGDIWKTVSILWLLWS